MTQTSNRSRRNRNNEQQEIEQSLDKDFHEFFHRLKLLTEKEMGDAIPIFSYSCGGLPCSTADIALNWADHSGPYLEALEWFEAMFRHCPDDEVEKVFAALSVEQKTILQRGYQIQYEHRFPPIFGHGLYYCVLAIAFDPTDALTFPVVRFRQNFFKNDVSPD